MAAISFPSFRVKVALGREPSTAHHLSHSRNYHVERRLGHVLTCCLSCAVERAIERQRHSRTQGEALEGAHSYARCTDYFRVLRREPCHSGRSHR